MLTLYYTWRCGLYAHPVLHVVLRTLCSPCITRGVADFMLTLYYTWCCGLYAHPVLHVVLRTLCSPCITRGVADSIRGENV